MLRAGPGKGPSAVLLVENIPVAEFDKPELVMRTLMRQAGLFQAYTFFADPAAAAAEFDKPDAAKQVMCLLQSHQASPSSHRTCVQWLCLRARLQATCPPTHVLRQSVRSYLSRPCTACSAVCAGAGIQVAGRLCDRAPAAARRIPAVLPHRRGLGADGCGASTAAWHRRRQRHRCTGPPGACCTHNCPQSLPACRRQGVLQLISCLLRQPCFMLLAGCQLRPHTHRMVCSGVVLRCNP